MKVVYLSGGGARDDVLESELRQTFQELLKRFLLCLSEEGRVLCFSGSFVSISQLRLKTAR
jgi:hypothetical protein